MGVADMLRAHGAAWCAANKGHVSLGQLRAISTITDHLVHSLPCPCCGGRMFIIGTFERGTTPRTRPWTLTLAIGFDSS